MAEIYGIRDDIVGTITRARIVISRSRRQSRRILIMVEDSVVTTTVEATRTTNVTTRK